MVGRGNVRRGTPQAGPEKRMRLSRYGFQWVFCDCGMKVKLPITS